MFLVEENGNGFVVVDILVFSHELYLFTDFQFIKNLTSLIVRKRCDVAAQEMLLVRFNLHNLPPILKGFTHVIFNFRCKGTTNYVTLEVRRCKKMSKKCIFSL